MSQRHRTAPSPSIDPSPIVSSVEAQKAYSEIYHLHDLIVKEIGDHPQRLGLWRRGFGRQ